MKQASVHITVSRLLSMALGWVLIAAAVGKGVRPDATLEAIRYLLHNIIGVSFEAPVAALAVLIVLEMALGAMLLSGWRSGSALWVSAAMLVPALIWTVYVASSGAPVSCGCGLPEIGVLGIDPDWVAVIRTGGLLVISMAALLLLSFRPSVRRVFGFLDGRFTFIPRSTQHETSTSR